MDGTHLGRSGLDVSRLCLGTMNFGQATDEPESHAIMDAAHEHGMVVEQRDASGRGSRIGQLAEGCIRRAVRSAMRAGRVGSRRHL